MKKRLLSALMAIAMLSAMLTAFADKDARTPIYIGDAVTDAVVDDLLDEIGARNLTDDTARIRACYDWIIKNCRREGDTDVEYFDFDDVIARYPELTEKYSAEVEAGRAAVFRNMQVPAQFADDSSYNSASYIDSSAGYMALYRVGECNMFAGLFAVMCMHLGYESYLIPGDFINSSGSRVMHKWNMIYVGGVPYWFDIRMDHAGYTSSGRISYTYFMKTGDDAWAKKHAWTREYTDHLKAQHDQGRRAYTFGGVDYTTLPVPDWSKCSAWAQPYLVQAQQQDLIPDAIKGMDMTQPITRQEFAAVAVTLYQQLSGQTARLSGQTPFRDSYDEFVLKAYELGVVKGVAADRFDPKGLLTREQGAAMLGRAYEVAENGAVGDGSQLDKTGAQSFTDDGSIGAYAKDYVYFLNARGVIDGVGDGSFAPLGNITREAALKIAVVMAEKLK